MRILLSAYACRPNAGSEPGTGWNWAIHLAEAGANVYLFTAERNREAIEGFLDVNPCPALHPHYIHVPRLHPGSSGLAHYFLWNRHALRQARALAKNVPIDIIHHVSYGSVHLPTPLWRLGRPTIFGPVGGGQTPPASLLSYFGEKRRGERIRTALTRMLPYVPPYRASIRRMSLVLAANRETMHLVQRAGASRVELLCDTGSRDDFRSDGPRSFSPGQPIRLLWVGRFLPRKGLALALDALARTRQEVHLTLVGDGLPREAVERLIAQRSLGQRVQWSGQRLSWRDMRQAYLTHDALLFTSLRDSFGSQNLEAMSLGLPVIALSLSGARDFIPDAAGIKVPPAANVEATVAALAGAIDRYAVLPVADRDRMSQAAWSGAADFAWTARAAYAQSLYAELAPSAIA